MPLPQIFTLTGLVITRLPTCMAFLTREMTVRRLLVLIALLSALVRSLSLTLTPTICFIAAAGAFVRLRLPLPDEIIVELGEIKA